MSVEEQNENSGLSLRERIARGLERGFIMSNPNEVENILRKDISDRIKNTLFC